MMLVTGPEEQDVLHPEDVTTDDKIDKNCEPEETCALETTDADDDNDEFVEWNEGDGNVVLCVCIHSVLITIKYWIFTFLKDCLCG